MPRSDAFLLLPCPVLCVHGIIAGILTFTEYTVWYVIVVWFHYLHTGCTQFAVEFEPVVDRIMGFLCPLIGDKGLMKACTEWMQRRFKMWNLYKRYQGEARSCYLYKRYQREARSCYGGWGQGVITPTALPHAPQYLSNICSIS